MPAELDGSAGLNRAPVPAHQAELNTDLQAVRAWIEIRGARSEATRRVYRREAQRLLLWAIVAKRKPLSSLNTLDAAEYLEHFLADPQPVERWIGRSWAERFDPASRPVVGSLSPRSRDTARRILTAMGAWLVRQQYLRVNPFDGLAAAAPVPIDTAGRTLTRAQWQFVLQTVWRPDPALGIGAGGTDAARLAEARARERDAFLLLLAYATGLRRAELAAATTVAAFSTRAREGLPVSVPIHHHELVEIKGADQWTVSNVLKRLTADYEAPWKDYPKVRQSITVAPRRRLSHR